MHHRIPRMFSELIECCSRASARCCPNESEEVGGEQLFSTLLGTSISGTPVQLVPVPHDVTSWKRWSNMNAETTVIAADEQYKKRYRKGDPKMYFLTDTIYYPSNHNAR